MSTGRCFTLFWVLLVGSALVLLGNLTNAPARAADGTGTWRIVYPPGPQPPLVSPWGVAVDGSGSVYVTDQGDHRIKKFSAGGKLLATWGSDTPGPLQLEDPKDVVVDKTGSIDVLDMGEVVRLSRTGQVIARWPGGDDLTVDPHGNPYFLRNSEVMQLSLNGTVLRHFPVGGGTPLALAVDRRGNVYVAVESTYITCTHCTDGATSEWWVLRYSSSGKLLNRDWGGFHEFTPPEGLAADQSGYLYVLTGGAGPKQVIVVSPDGRRQTSFALPQTRCGMAPDFWSPTLDHHGAMYLAAMLSQSFTEPAGAVLKVWNTGRRHAWIGGCPATPPASLLGLARDRLDNLYTLDRTTGHILKISPAGERLADWPALPLVPPFPIQIAVSAEGTIYLPSTHGITRLSATGELLPAWSLPDTVTQDPVGVALTPQNNLLVTVEDSRILTLSPQGQVLAVWDMKQLAQGVHSPPGNWFALQALTVDGEGQIYVADNQNQSVFKLSPDGKVLARIHLPGLNGRGLAVDPHGNIYVPISDGLAELSPVGEPLNIWGRIEFHSPIGSAPGQFSRVSGLVLDQQGNVYATDSDSLYGDRIQKLTLGG